MALSPQFVDETVDVNSVVEEFEELIDLELTGRTPVKAGCAVHLAIRPRGAVNRATPLVAAKLREKYIVAGWSNLQFTRSTRDAGCLGVSLSTPIHYTHPTFDGGPI